MEYLKKLLNLESHGWVDWLIETALLSAISVVLVWFFFWLLTKLLGKRTKQHRDVFLRMQYLWALFAFLLIFTVYWFYFVKTNGLHSFHWQSGSFYMSISPQMLVFVISILLFSLNYRRLRSLVKQQ